MAGVMRLDDVFDALASGGGGKELLGSPPIFEAKFAQRHTARATTAEAKAQGLATTCCPWAAT